jgi:hypothetical protein
MLRTARRSVWLLAILMTMLLLQAAGGAATASAATTCRQYSGFPTDTGTVLNNVRVCAAPAADFPTYSGWGRVVDTYSTRPNNCGFSLLPYDVNEPRPLYACLAVMPAPVATWRWTGSSWVKGPGLDIGSRAYFAPYAAGWRWAWTASTGWVAVAESHAAFRWST